MTYPETPGFRTRGTPGEPSPDMLAAEQVAAHTPRLLQRCLTLLVHGDTACTADEAAVTLGINQQTARARFSQLYALHLVTRDGRGTSSAGNRQWRYRVNEAGRAAHAAGGPKVVRQPAPQAPQPVAGDSQRLHDRILEAFQSQRHRIDFTADEIAMYLDESPRNVRPRICELVRYGLLAQTDRTRASAKGQPQRVYILKRRSTQ